MLKIEARERWVYLAAAAYAAGVAWRFVYIFITHPIFKYFYSDMQSYATAAVKFYTPGSLLGPGDTIYPPGTAYIYGLVYHVFHSWVAVEALQFFFAAAVPLLIAAIGYQLFTKKVALIALFISSLYPAFVIYSGFLLSETAATFLLLLSFWLLVLALKQKSRSMAVLLAMICGLVFGAAVSVRSQVFLSGVMVGIFLIFYTRRRRPLRYLVLVAVGMAMVALVPLSARCTLLNKDRLCVVSTNGALGVLQGHYGTVGHFNFYDEQTHSDWEFGNPTTLQQGNTDYASFQFGPYDQTVVLGEAFSWIYSHPTAAIGDSFKHVRDLFWGSVPWPPSNTSDRRLIIVSEWLFRLFILLPGVVYSLLLCFKGFRRRAMVYKHDLMLMAPIIGIILTIFITVAEPRYRIPFDGFFILLAARAYDRKFSNPR